MRKIRKKSIYGSQYIDPTYYELEICDGFMATFYVSSSSALCFYYALVSIIAFMLQIKTSIAVKAIADNDKYMERKHVKPVIEFA